MLNLANGAASVSRIASKEQLVRNIVRLRRAERASPAGEDIAAVRADLERTVGPTVPRAMAARLLGVSQTALDRWVARGDIPAVMTRTGRQEVPLHALADLAESVQEHTETGAAPHPLAAVLRARRSDAERLDLPRILPPSKFRDRSEHGHRKAELRGLAYHRVVAARLDRRLVDDALHRLRRWRTEGKIDARNADRWKEILSWPLPQVASLISRDNQPVRDLRQNSPFAGALTERERRRVLDAVSRAAR